jgi:cell wall-associated NlpC family hydrolase
MSLLSVCALAAVCFTGSAFAQGRERVVKPTSSQPTNLQPAPIQVQPPSESRPILANKITVMTSVPTESLIKKTVSSMPVNAPNAIMTASKTAYGSATSVRLDRAIKSRYGTPYRYGSTGPNSYDCSGFVWSAFQEAGINFTRASARTIWSESELVDGDDRYKFGTLVFFNGLGHVGIVADENGFYQASSSKGITYSPFKGYWEKRIVGFRKLKPETTIAVER